MTMVLMMLTALVAQDSKEDANAAAAALKEFKADYKPSRSEAERAVAVKRLASSIEHSKVLSRLASITGRDVEIVRIEAVLGLGNYTDEKLKKKASSSLFNAIAPNQRLPAVTKVIFESIGRLGQASHIRMLPRFFGHRNVEIAEGAILGAGVGRRKISIPYIIKTMEKHAPKADKTNNTNNLTGTNQGGGQVNVPGGGGSVPGLKLPGGRVGGGGSKSKKAVRDARIYKATITAMQTISGDKWSTYAEWVVWWRRNASRYKDPE